MAMPCEGAVAGEAATGSGAAAGAVVQPKKRKRLNYGTITVPPLCHHCAITVLSLHYHCPDADE